MITFLIISAVVVAFVWWNRNRASEAKHTSSILQTSTASNTPIKPKRETPSEPTTASSGTPVKEGSAEPNPVEAALLRQIAERSKTDPLIGAKLGSKDVTHRLQNAMKTERGIHMESLLCALAALAGYACQAAVRAQAAARGASAERALTAVKTKDGRTYFFGDAINKLVAESRYSVWGIVAAGAQQAGCKQLPDIAEIFKHTAAVVGSDAFGKPRLPPGHGLSDTPINYTLALWPRLEQTTKMYCANPLHWPVLFSLSIQELIVTQKAVIDPGVAALLVMETAIATSKIDLSGYNQP